MGSQERGSMGAPSFTFFRIKSWACNAMHPGLASFASDSRNFYVKMGLVFNFLRFFFCQANSIDNTLIINKRILTAREIAQKLPTTNR